MDESKRIKENNEIVFEMKCTKIYAVINIFLEFIHTKQDFLTIIREMELGEFISEWTL